MRASAEPETREKEEEMMKRLIPLMILLAAFVWSPFAWAEMHHSDFGYVLDIPSDWTVLSEKNVREKPELVDAAFAAAQKDKDLSDLPKNVLSDVKEMILGGKVEYYYSLDPRFTISVFKGRGEVPRTSEKLGETCQALPQELSKYSKRKIRVYECKLKPAAGQEALYVVADDYWKGKKFIQYQVQKAPDRILLFTASSKDRDFGEMRDAFDKVMATLKLE
jgi:hypothetical protein